jgi:hypothetical protein
VTSPDRCAALFLEGAAVVAEAIGDPAVGAAWDLPSVLEDQRVSGLAGHLARGAVWVVDEYLAGGEGPGSAEPPDYVSAGHYYASVAGSATEEMHRGVRDRGAAVAAVGQQALVAELLNRIVSLETLLARVPPDHVVAVFAGRRIRLEDYLVSRMVEQAVHLDDLARSVGRDPWPLPEDLLDAVVAVGTEVARRRHGDGAVLRALYRRGFAGAVLPVL